MAVLFPKPFLRNLLTAAGLAAILALGAGIVNEGMAAAPRPSSLRLLGVADHDLFVRAYAAANRGDWTQARSLAAQGSSALARQLLEWRYAREGGASFAEIDAALKQDAAWPGRALLYARAEQAIAPDTDASTLIAWFGTRTPATAIGRIRLGDALIVQGGTQAARGQALVRDGWVQGSFDAATEAAILEKDGTLFTQVDERTRMDALLWRGEITTAKRQLPRVTGDAATVATARIALASGLAKAKAALAKAASLDDPALLLEWSRALRLDKQDDAAHAKLLRIPTTALLPAHATRLWNETSIQLRDALQAGDARTAMALASHPGLTAGDEFVDQQFLGGFIALRFLKDANAALPFFQRLDGAVSRPISRSRAQYWQGRAYDALNDTANAATHYRQAAAFPDTFYGQLALARLGQTDNFNPPGLEATVTPAPQADLDAAPLMGAIKLLAELGQESDLRLFADAYAADIKAPAARRLMEDLTAWGYPDLAVRLAKTWSYADNRFFAYSHPVIPLPALSGGGTAPEPALVLGLIRQETEFDPYAVSSAGAEGLMQVMPANVKQQSKVAGLPARREALLSDTTYNMQLGMSEFADLTAHYDGSLVLAIAGYNAGPGNAARWIKANGDPRLAGTDPVDWIELIPFGETRNYVQRVLENTGVYRVRLAGKPQPLLILRDLYAPNAPP